MPPLDELRQKPHWSYSSLNQLLSICSLQWAFRHGYLVTPEFTPVSLVFGRTFHRACEQVAVQRLHGDEINEPEVLALFGDLWRQECRCAEPAIRFGEDKDADSLVVTGQQMLSAFLAKAEPRERVVAVNLVFSVPLVEAQGQTLPKPLIGELDAVVDYDGLPAVVDWKTSASRWPEGKAHQDLQATAYLYAADAGGVGGSELEVRARQTPNAKRQTPPLAFRYDVVTKAKKPTCERHWTTRETDDFRRLVVLANMAERIVQHELFVPNDGSFYCAGCPYQGACKSWHRTAARTVSVAA